MKLTKSCAEHIRTVGSPGQGLRVEVEGGEGCGGFTYKFKLDSPQPNDLIFEEFNAQLIIDPDSYQLIDGSTIDYTQELIRRSFVVLANPHAEMTCGCGTSFSPAAFNLTPPPPKNKSPPSFKKS